MTESSVRVRQAAAEVAIQVLGRATAPFCPALRELLHAAWARGVRRLVFDLGQCVYLDSTFIGVLTMAAVQHREAPGQVRIANAGPLPRRHLASLGVDRLFAYVDLDLGDGPWEPLNEDADATAASRLQALGRTALEAHEALGAANPDNVARFKDVVESLRHETR
jgi:anti-sigma B factor antagonist